MSVTSGRASRRRRMLNDGRLATGESESNAPESDASESPAGGAPRYAPEPSSVSFGLAARVLPTGSWSLAGVALCAIAATAALTAADLYQTEIAGVFGERAVELIEVSEARSLASWATTTLSLSIVGLCGVIFALRRHRSDDLRGVYRWWMFAAFAALVTSVCLATGLHQVLAGLVAARVGWSPLAGDALWWLLPAAVTIGVVGVRVFLDLKESRLAAMSAVVAAISATTAFVASNEWAPAAAQPFLSSIEYVALNLSLSAVVFSLLAYARRIVLEVGGKVAAPVKVKRTKIDEAKQEAHAAPAVVEKRKATRSAKQKDDSETTAPVETPEPTRQRTRKASKPQIAKETATEWVDGSHGDVDDGYDDGESRSRRKLTKAERKRLRKQKAREQRAA